MTKHGLFPLLFQQTVADENPHMEAIFTEIFERNTWGGISKSGTGSDCVQTAGIQKALPRLLQAYNCRTIADAPCGDFFWMQHVDLASIDYLGVDVVAALIQKNQSVHGNEKRHFMHVDITRQILPPVDMIFCRDALVHFSYADIGNTIRKFKESGSIYLLTTCYTASHHKDMNIPISTGHWRPIDLRKDPFFFPEPIEILHEGCTEAPLYSDKSLFLWRLADIFTGV